MPTSFTQAGQRYYILTDQVGTPKVISDAHGAVIKQIDYDAFGNVISDSKPEFKIPSGFAGGLQDTDTGLIRFGYRDYDPETGRWTARDPIGLAVTAIGGVLVSWDALTSPAESMDQAKEKLKEAEEALKEMERDLERLKGDPYES